MIKINKKLIKNKNKQNKNKLIKKMKNNNENIWMNQNNQISNNQ